MFFFMYITIGEKRKCFYSLIGHEEYGKQSINDGKLEVVALYSSFHVAQLQVGLSQLYRLGQASNMKVYRLFR